MGHHRRIPAAGACRPPNNVPNHFPDFIQKSLYYSSRIKKSELGEVGLAIRSQKRLKINASLAAEWPRD